MSTTNRTEDRDQLEMLLKDGFKALSIGDIEVAAEHCQKLLKIQPDLVPAHFLTGLTGLAAQDRKTAFSAFQSVVKLDKDHAAAWAHLAKMYMSEGHVNKADTALRETRRIRPQDPIVLDLIGTTLSLMGEHGVAQAFFTQANSSHPQYPPYMQNLANNFVYHGETDQAKDVFNGIISIQADSPQAHWGLASSQKARDEGHIQQMRALLGKRTQDPRAKAFYLYAIGKELEDLEQWEEAFEAFSQAASSRRSTVEFDEAAEIEMFDALEQNYTQDWSRQEISGNNDDSAIFVLGQPRTGTTLIERIITSHTQVHSAGELQQFGLALRRLGKYNNPKRFSAELFNTALALEPE